MPHLMLEFLAEREVQEKGGKLTPSGKEHISFRMIDTDHGKVIELKADASNIEQVEREPKWGELEAATHVLGKQPGAEQRLKELKKIEAERDSYRQKHLAAQAEMVAKNELIVKLNEQINKLKKSSMSKYGDLIGNALTSHIEELAASMRFEEYENAKVVYEIATGQKWLDDGSDLDEEGDLPGSG